MQDPTKFSQFSREVAEVYKILIQKYGIENISFPLILGPWIKLPGNQFNCYRPHFYSHRAVVEISYDRGLDDCILICGNFEIIHLNKMRLGCASFPEVQELVDQKLLEANCILLDKI